MKYIIQTIVPLLFTFANLYAETEIINYQSNQPSIEYYSTDEFYRPEFTQTDSVEEPIIQSDEEASYLPDTTSPTVSDENNIIVPDAFKREEVVPFEHHAVEYHEVSLSEAEEVSNTSSLVMEDNDIDTPTENYAGFYKLIKGSDSFKGMFESINDGFMVIEKLDENDFGFYYVIQSKDFAPNEKYGIFHYKEGKFFQKFIDDSELRDNVTLKKFGSSLETSIITVRGTQSIQWEERSEAEISMLNPKLQKALELTKENYRQIYRDRFKN